MTESMTDPTDRTRQRILWAVALVVGVGLALFLLWPQAEERLAPELVGAHVAVQAEGSRAAVVGPVRLESGQAFTLHAVLEARDRDGNPVYYTEAEALEWPGADGEAARTASGASLRPWDRPRPARVFWFTIEGAQPLVQLPEGSPDEQLEALRSLELAPFLRPDWTTRWSVPGRVDPSPDNLLADPDGEPLPFGTQRFQARIELFESETSTVAVERYPSPGADALPEAAESFPTAIMALPGALEAPSRVFGLTQVEPPSSPAPAVRDALAELQDRGLAFSRPLVLARMLGGRRGETGRQALGSEAIDLAAGPAWSDGSGSEGGVAPGDLLQAGSRTVVLYRDEGEPGVLDREDLCFDFERGARVERLDDVFTGEGLVQLTRLDRSGA